MLPPVVDTFEDAFDHLTWPWLIEVVGGHHRQRHITLNVQRFIAIRKVTLATHTGRRAHWPGRSDSVRGVQEIELLLRQTESHHVRLSPPWSG